MTTKELLKLIDETIAEVEQENDAKESRVKKFEQQVITVGDQR